MGIINFLWAILWSKREQEKNLAASTSNRIRDMNKHIDFLNKTNMEYTKQICDLTESKSTKDKSSMEEKLLEMGANFFLGNQAKQPPQPPKPPQSPLPKSDTDINSPDFTNDDIQRIINLTPPDILSQIATAPKVLVSAKLKQQFPTATDENIDYAIEAAQKRIKEGDTCQATLQQV